MKIEIEYCVAWNYEPRARRARDILSSLADAEIALKKGRNGVFDVTIDGKLAYSKRQTGRFPTDDEVRALLVG